MLYRKFVIRDNGDKYLVEAYIGIDHGVEKLYEREADQLSIGGMEVDLDGDMEIECGGASPEARFSDLRAVNYEGIEFRLDPSSGCDHPVIGLEQI